MRSTPRLQRIAECRNLVDTHEIGPHSARMPTWVHQILEAMPFVAWAVCGLLAFLLQPGNRAARRLAAVGIFFPASRLLDYLLADHPGAAAELSSSWLARWLDDTFFVAGTSALVATLAVFPNGRYERRFEKACSTAFPAIALIGSLCRLFGSPVMTYGGEPATGVPNGAFLPALRPLGSVGEALIATEPAWIPVGVVLLVLRFRRSRAGERAELMWPLAAIGSFALSLIVILTGRWALALAGMTLEDELVSSVFLTVLSLFPVSLILTFAARARRIQGELALSRQRIVRAEADARRRIERDLHDGIQQQLVGLLSLLQLASRDVARGNHDSGSSTLRQAAAQTRQAITDLRDLVSGIHPAVLSDRGLGAALAELLARPGVPVRLEVEPGLGRWSADVEAAAYFVACEALTNAIKHADAAEIVISLDAPQGNLRIRVRDDGRGFHPQEVHLRGLDGARDRVEALNGKLSVRSEPGRGTVLEVTLPEKVQR